MKSLKAPKTCVISDGRRKVHSVFTDDSEMVEEYDVITDELLVRKVRRPSPLGGEPPWEVEVGTDHTATKRKFNPDGDLLKEASGTPVVVRQDTPKEHQWRIRNMNFATEVYSVAVEGDDSIVIRTTNKKYFKKLDIPEMVRLGLKLAQSELSWVHQHNTLIISYKKHLAVQTQEVTAKRERETMEPIRLGDDKQNCAQQ